MPDCDAQDVLAQVLPQDVANLTCVPLVVIIGKASMMEVSLYPALTGCKGTGGKCNEKEMWWANSL
ncbi:hypothetical protein AB1K18_01420 [Peribacillus simplex]|uniref:hypothetical protein n=1 Tax=Peribacillus simplex TaxID=1478 RepID=UPI003B8C5A62